MALAYTLTNRRCTCLYLRSAPEVYGRFVFCNLVPTTRAGHHWILPKQDGRGALAYTWTQGVFAQYFLAVWCHESGLKVRPMQPGSDGARSVTPGPPWACSYSRTHTDRGALCIKRCLGGVDGGHATAGRLFLVATAHCGEIGLRFAQRGARIGISITCSSVACKAVAWISRCSKDAAGKAGERNGEIERAP